MFSKKTHMQQATNQLIRTTSNTEKNKNRPKAYSQAASFIFRKFQLIMYQLEIISSICHQLLMRSLFHDLPMTQDKDVVSMTNRGEAVGYHDARAVCKHRLQILRDFPFVFGIQRTCGLVQHEIKRTLVDRTRDHHALPFSAAHADSLAANFGLDTDGKPLDIVFQTGGTDSRCQPSLVHRFAKNYIAAYRVRKHEIVLHHNTGDTAHGFGAEASQRLSAQKDFALRGLIEFQKKFHQRCLSAAAFPDDGRHLPCWNREIEVLQHRLTDTARIGEGEVFHHDVARGVCRDVKKLHTIFVLTEMYFLRAFQTDFRVLKLLEENR